VVDLPVLARRTLALREATVVRDSALAAVRVALAWIFIYHGASTLFGAFHGAGLQRTATFFSSVAHLHPGMFFAVLNGVTEFFGGIAVGIGLCTRLAALGLFFDMVIATVTVTWRNGIVSDAAGSGYELNLALAALAFAMVLMGAGRVSADAWAWPFLGQKWRRSPQPGHKGNP
jgi:putative oxidoreductase